MAVLNDRLAALATEPSTVLAVVRAASFHVIGSDDHARRTDPYVTPVLDALAWVIRSSASGSRSTSGAMRTGS
jgi:hypothetical protein